MSAYLIVRAEMIDPAARDPFDRWYAEEHLPEALQKFNARSAWRGWSDVDPMVHMAFYEFPDLETVSAMASSDVIKGLIAEFDRHWEGKVTRTRDIVAAAQRLEAS